MFGLTHPRICPEFSGFLFLFNWYQNRKLLWNFLPFSCKHCLVWALDASKAANIGVQLSPPPTQGVAFHLCSRAGPLACPSGQSHLCRALHWPRIFCGEVFILHADKQPQLSQANKSISIGPQEIMSKSNVAPD